MKLMTICACERVIIDKITNGHSLISVLVNAEIRQPTEIVVPSDAVAPAPWYVFTLWESDPEESGKTFEQVLEVRWPNGEIFAANRLPVTTDESLMAQFAVGINTLPIGQVGKVVITSWIEHEGERKTPIATYYFKVKHNIPS